MDSPTTGHYAPSLPFDKKMRGRNMKTSSTIIMNSSCCARERELLFNMGSSTFFMYTLIIIGSQRGIYTRFPPFFVGFFKENFKVSIVYCVTLLSNSIIFGLDNFILMHKKLLVKTVDYCV